MPEALRADHTTREEAGYILVAHAAQLANRDPATTTGLLGAGIALFTQANRPLPPEQERTVPDILELCRSALGPDMFRETYERAATMDGPILAELIALLGGRHPE